MKSKKKKERNEPRLHICIRRLCVVMALLCSVVVTNVLRKERFKDGDASAHRSGSYLVTLFQE